MTTLGKVLVVGLCLGGMTTLAQESDNTLCLRVKGIVVDYATHRPLSDAKLFAKLPTGRKRISISSKSGDFIAEAPCEATAILIERTGYRSQILSLHQPSVLHDTQAVVILIPLVAIEHQGNDRTYLQTEQTDYIQHSSALKVNKTDSNAVQHSLFMIKDAIRDTPLQAKACFFFTKNGDKKCLNSDSKGLFKLDFTQTDIVAVEVTSSGYQTYAGNLIVEALDGRFLPRSCLNFLFSVDFTQENDRECDKM